MFWAVQMVVLKPTCDASIFLEVHDVGISIVLGVYVERSSHPEFQSNAQVR